MLSNDKNTPIFSMPGGESSSPARSRPIDLVHLARQTMGDRVLEQEILCLFVHQTMRVRQHIAKADATECRRLAHGLKGSARSVGAFAIADCAEEIEHHPDDAHTKRKLARLIDEVRDFVAAIGR